MPSDLPHAPGSSPLVWHRTCKYGCAPIAGGYDVDARALESGARLQLTTSLVEANLQGMNRDDFRHDALAGGSGGGRVVKLATKLAIVAVLILVAIFADLAYENACFELLVPLGRSLEVAS
jgi:hypothetical protein